VDRALSIAVVDNDTADTVRTKRLLTGALWAALATSTLSAIQFFATGANPSGYLLATVPPVLLATLFALWRWPSVYPNVMHPLAAQAILISAVQVVMAGGLHASAVNSVWILVVILGALAVFADRRATIWLWVFVASQIIASWWASQIEPVLEVPNPEFQSLSNLLVVTVFVFYLLNYYVRQRALLLEQSDGLLSNILPREIAERLKESEEAIADAYDQASILFADVVDFTPMSAGMKPSGLVALLDEVFTAFDELVEARDLEKIKTIGDAYMVASGVPRPREDHALVLCDLALAVQELTKSRDFNGHSITFRIGINSGPVVAGVIGTKKFSYDLWGDAVNTASRMESSGEAGGIQMTEATKLLVEDSFICSPRGTVEIKGKGPMPVWELIGRAP
jgi:guanylate cyclase